LYADLGKSSENLLKDGFPSVDKKGKAKSGLEVEVNTKTERGVKVQAVVDKKEEAFVTTLKPTYPFRFGSVNGDLKLQLGTDSTTKIDSSVNFDAVSGLKLKFGSTGPSDFSTGFDFVNPSIAANAKLNFPTHNFESAAVFVHGSKSFGALVKRENEALSYEGKAEFSCKDSAVLLGAEKSDLLKFSANYLHRFSDSKALATKLNYVAAEGGLRKNLDFTLVTSNKVDDSTLFKSRFNSTRQSIGFSVSSEVNSNLKLEWGTEFPANLQGPTSYNLKVTYN